MKEMTTGEMIASGGLILALLTTAFGILWWSIRAEMKPSVQRLSDSAEHLARAIDRVNITMERALTQLGDHETRITVLEQAPRPRPRIRRSA